MPEDYLKHHRRDDVRCHKKLSGQLVMNSEFIRIPSNGMLLLSFVRMQLHRRCRPFLNFGAERGPWIQKGGET